MEAIKTIREFDGQATEWIRNQWSGYPQIGDKIKAFQAKLPQHYIANVALATLFVSLARPSISFLAYPLARAAYETANSDDYTLLSSVTTQAGFLFDALTFPVILRLVASLSTLGWLATPPTLLSCGAALSWVGLRAADLHYHKGDLLNKVGKLDDSDISEGSQFFNHAIGKVKDVLQI